MNSAVLLSRGGTWKPSPWDPPYLMPDPGSTWPEKAWAAITFTDTAGVELLTLDGDVTPEGIHFTGDPEEMDPIPAGAGFTITLETGDGIFPIRYGTVIRKEVFYTQPTNRPVSTPRRFSDTFQRKTLGNKWIPIVGRTIIRNNSALSLPNGVSPEVAFFQKSAIRWWEEFSSDTVDIGIAVLNTDPILAGRTTLVLCADALFTTGIGVRFETAALSNKLHLGTITGPNTLVDETPAVTNTVANLDHYRIRYTDSTKTVAVYKNSSLDPALEWTADAASIAHGRGYRHFGMAFESALIGRGIQVTSITAMDAA